MAAAASYASYVVCPVVEPGVGRASVASNGLRNIDNLGLFGDSGLLDKCSPRDAPGSQVEEGWMAAAASYASYVVGPVVEPGVGCASVASNGLPNIDNLGLFGDSGLLDEC